jgi:hypothetical protein
MIYAAYADFKITPEEREYIQKKVDQDDFRHILKLFEKDGEFQRSETVRILGEKFCNRSDIKCDIRTDLIKLFFADEDYILLEKNFFICIKKILNLNE